MPRTLGQALGFLLGFWIALQLSPLQVAAAREPAPHGALEAALHEAINAARAGRHLVALRRLPDLDAVARAHAEDMARRGYLAHENPSGANPLERLLQTGLEGFTLAAENVGRTTERPPNERILDSWLASEVHRRNLLMPAFNATGLAIAAGPDGSLVYAQIYVSYPR